MLVSRVRLFLTAWTVACQAPLSMEFSRQEYWRGLPLSSPGDPPDPGIELRSPTLRADSLLSASLELISCMTATNKQNSCFLFICWPNDAMEMLLSQGIMN